MTLPKAVSGKVLSQPLVSVLQQCADTCSCGLPILSSTELGNAGQIAGRNQYLERVGHEGVGPHLGNGWEAAGETGVLGGGRASAVN